MKTGKHIVFYKIIYDFYPYSQKSKLGRKYSILQNLGEFFGKRPTVD